MIKAFKDAPKPETGEIMESRVYICHTIYHAYIACLKELALPAAEQGKADLILSTMSNDFGTFPGRAQRSGLWRKVFLFEEKQDFLFPEIMKYHTDRGSTAANMLARIRYTKLLGKAQEKYIPTDLKAYGDVYVFCDSDPIGYYLNYRHIRYHAVEDGLDTIYYCDDALYSNRGHFGLKKTMAALGLIHIPDGYARYCIDMEVNNASILHTPCKKYKEVPRRGLYDRLTAADKDLLLRMFLEDADGLKRSLVCSGEEAGQPAVLILTDPLCDLETRQRIFEDIIKEYGTADGRDAKVIIKPHPRDLLDYKKLFPEYTVLPGAFPMEMLNFLPGVRFRRVVTVFTVPDAIYFADEKVFLGPEFMDRYEPHELHDQIEAVAAMKK